MSLLLRGFRSMITQPTTQHCLYICFSITAGNSTLSSTSISRWYFTGPSHYNLRLLFSLSLHYILPSISLHLLTLTQVVSTFKLGCAHFLAISMKFGIWRTIPVRVFFVHYLQVPTALHSVHKGQTCAE